MSDGITGAVSDLGKDFIKEGKQQIVGPTNLQSQIPQTQQAADPSALLSVVSPKEEKNIAIQRQILDSAIDRARLKRDETNQQYRQKTVTSQSMPQTDLPPGQSNGMSTDRVLQVSGRRGEMKGNKSGE